MTPEPAPSGATSQRAIKIVLLVVLGVVAVCGVVGTCLFALLVAFGGG